MPVHDGDDIGGDADESRVAETDHPAIAEDEVQAHRRDSHDHDPHADADQERIVEKACDLRQEGQRHQHRTRPARLAA